MIAVKRGFLELEHAGVLVTRRGKGSFVAEDANLGTSLKEQELDEHPRLYRWLIYARPSQSPAGTADAAAAPVRPGVPASPSGCGDLRNALPQFHAKR